MSTDVDRLVQFAQILDRLSPAEIGALHASLLHIKALSDAGEDVDEAAVRRSLEESGYMAARQQNARACAAVDDDDAGDEPAEPDLLADLDRAITAQRQAVAAEEADPRLALPDGAADSAPTHVAAIVSQIVAGPVTPNSLPAKARALGWYHETTGQDDPRFDEQEALSRQILAALVDRLKIEPMDGANRAGQQQIDNACNQRLFAKAQALVNAVSFDENGAMVAGQLMGGNGGLISRETIKAVDALRIEMQAWKGRLLAAGSGESSGQIGRENHPQSPAPAGILPPDSTGSKSMREVGSHG